MPVRDLSRHSWNPLTTDVQPDRGTSSLSRLHDGGPACFAEMNSTLSGRRDGRNGMPPDNWIYIQEPDVRIGRLQIFNNWSPALVADPRTIWLGLEYFCREGDDLWSMDDCQFVDFAARRTWKKSA